MSSFFGKYYYTIDPKGRIIIPAPLREIILNKYNNAKLYITNAPFDKCLELYPHDEWLVLQNKIRSMPKVEDAVQYFLRRVIAPAVECEVDKQGRILIPYEHRQDAGIMSEVVIVGLIDIVQVWDKAQWDAVADPSKIDVKAFKTALAGYGL
jgi:MraZ protein